MSDQVRREHQKVDLERRLRYADLMELPELGDEKTEELYLDAVDSIQQIQPELVTQRSFVQSVEMEGNQGESCSRQELLR